MHTHHPFAPLSHLDPPWIHHSTQMTAQAANSAVLVQFPEEDLRARRIVSRSRARPTGKYPSWKMGRMCQWESVHELNALRLLDLDPAVIGFQEQPAEIRFELNGEPRRHFPDILVTYQTRREFWEVKASPEYLDPETVARTTLLTAALKGCGYGYRLILGNDLSRQPRLSNALTILRHGREALTPTDRITIERRLGPSGALDWGQTTQGHLGPRGIQQICRLILEGVVRLDMNQPLESGTKLCWGSPSDCEEA